MKILESGTENICFHDWWAYIISAGLGKVIWWWQQQWNIEEQEVM